MFEGLVVQILAGTNFLLGVYDCYLTQRRIKLFGRGFELNRLIKAISTLTGPEIAAVIGVLGPVVGWTYIFCYFNLTWALALMVGYGLKRFEMQLSSIAFEKNAIEIQKLINEKLGSESATLPDDESTSQSEPSNLKEGK
jgi:hypothetical protein